MWFWSIFLQIRSIFWLIIPILFAFQTSTFMSHRNIKLNMPQHKYIIAPWKTFSAFCITHISKFEDRSKQLIMLFMTPFHYSQLVMKFLMVSYIYLVFAHPFLLFYNHLPQTLIHLHWVMQLPTNWSFCVHFSLPSNPFSILQQELASKNETLNMWGPYLRILNGILLSKKIKPQTFLLWHSRSFIIWSLTIFESHLSHFLKVHNSVISSY